MNRSHNPQAGNFYPNPNNQNANQFFTMWQQRPNPLNLANNENFNHMNQMQNQQQIVNIGDLENRIKQNNDLFHLLSQIKQNQYQQNQLPNRRQSDLEKFMEKISAGNANQRQMANQIPQNLNEMPGMNGYPAQNANPHAIMESFRQIQQQIAANNGPTMNVQPSGQGKWAYLI